MKQFCRILLPILLCFGAGDSTLAQIGPPPLVTPSFFAPSRPCDGSTGGTIAVIGGYRIHTFTSSGTFTASGNCTVSYLAVAGGGAGSLDCGAAGAGGFLQGSASLSAGPYSITVGAGGSNFVNGGNSAIDSIAIAVGGGAGSSSINGNGSAGGSGAGGNAYTGSGGAGTPGQGYNGGHGFDGTGSGEDWGGGGGGGGANGPGGNAPSISLGGTSGPGVSSSISGASVCYAGGGRGAASLQSGSLPSAGCGGGNASTGSDANGAANTGGGGGGRCTGTSAPGGSGIVIIAYPYP